MLCFSLCFSSGMASLALGRGVMTAMATWIMQCLSCFVEHSRTRQAGFTFVCPWLGGGGDEVRASPMMAMKMTIIMVILKMIIMMLVGGDNSEGLKALGMRCPRFESGTLEL